MTQVSDSSESPVAPAQQPSPPDQYGRSSRLDQIWSVVAIAAGTVFIVSVIFFWGFFLGRATDGPHGGHRGSGGGMGDSSCPMMGSGGGMRPGMMSPGPSADPHQSATPTPQPTPHP